MKKERKSTNIQILMVIIAMSIWFSACSTDSNSEYNLKTNLSPVEGGTISPANGVFEEGE